MSAIRSHLPPVTPTEPVFPLSVEQYHSMIESGVLTDDDPVELLEGVLVFTIPKNAPHAFVVDAAADLVGGMLQSGWYYRRQDPVTLSDGEPEPDGLVVRGSRNDYRHRHPGPDDVAIVIEVSDSTLSRDRGIKLRSYARAGLAVYWIINLVDRCVEVYTTPDPARATYAPPTVFDANASVPVQVNGIDLGPIPVRDLLP